MPDNARPLAAVTTPEKKEMTRAARVNLKRSECAVVVSQKLVDQTAKIAKIGRRSQMVQSLLNSYHLLEGMRLLSPTPISNSELRVFHSEDYVAFLEKPDEVSEENFGLGYDCPVVADLGEFVRWIAGGSIAAADALVSGQARVAFNWHGGWHHAKAHTPHKI